MTQREYRLEDELISANWIVKKVRGSEVYAQNLYAALCNNRFEKININNTEENLSKVLVNGFPRWTCSWRSAGGIVADILGEGDYMDWYCSGIRFTDFERENADTMTPEQKQRAAIMQHYVEESVIVDEIRQDLAKLGWVQDKTYNTE